jgi:hypothetical protein
MDQAAREAEREWLASGAVEAGLRALLALAPDPRDALRHSWLEELPLRRAYAGHLAGAGSPLGRCLQAQLALEHDELDAERRSVLTHLAWELEDRHGLEWLGGERSGGGFWPRDETPLLGGYRGVFRPDDQWRLRGGRLVSLPQGEDAEGTHATLSIKHDESGQALLHALLDGPPEQELRSLLVIRTEAAEARGPLFPESRLPLRSLALATALTPEDLRSWWKHTHETLEELSLQDWGRAPVFPSALELTWPRLRSLDIGGVPSQPVLAPDPGRFPCLSEIFAMGTEHAWLPAFSPRLRKLRLRAGPFWSSAYFATPGCPVAEIVRAASDLEALDLHGFAVDEAALRALGELPCLRSLSIREAGLSAADVGLLARLPFPALRSLELDPERLGPEAVNALVGSPLLSRLEDVFLPRTGLAMVERLLELPDLDPLSLTLDDLSLRAARSFLPCGRFARLNQLVVRRLSREPLEVSRILEASQSLGRLSRLVLDPLAGSERDEDGVELWRVWGTRMDSYLGSWVYAPGDP